MSESPDEADASHAALPEPEEPGLHRAVFLAAPDGIVVVDREGMIREVNPRVETLFGYAREELLGQEIEILVPDAVRDLHRRHRDRYLEHPAPRPMGIGMELVGRAKDGTEIPVEISLSPVPASGGRVIAMIRDVTERRRLRDFGIQALRITEEERQRLARELHDDTAQRLAALLLHLRSARRVTDPEEREGALDRLRDEIEETAEGIRRVARGLRPPALQDAGVGTALRTHVRRVMEPSDLDVEVDLEPVEGVLSEDAQLVLYRIAQEALSNVLRHARAGRVALRVRRAGESVVAEIEDDGRGFDPSHPADGGAGLGLLGMRERAMAVGGRVSIESEPGAGTRVRVVLPAGGAHRRPGAGEGRDTLEEEVAGG